MHHSNTGTIFSELPTTISAYPPELLPGCIKCNIPAPRNPAPLEFFSGPPPFKSVLITGPFMPKQERKDVFKRARRLGVRTYHFYRQMEKIFAAADIVVSMGGYNTLCEILGQGTLSLVIPRETPRKEQIIRARAFARQNLVDYIPWGEFTSDLLRQKLLFLLENPEPYHEAISRFQLTGIETMQKRLREFRCLKS